MKCVVGMGGVVGRHVRPIKNLTFIFFFFFGSDWDVTVCYRVISSKNSQREKL